MKLLTKELLKKFRAQGNTDGKPTNEIKIIAKFFNPTGPGTWYAIEYLEDEKLFFGFVSLFNDFNDELGYFSLKELESYKGPLGIGIERDVYFGEHTLEEILNGARP